MTPEQIERTVRGGWDQYGACASCGWHALLSEYDLRSAHYNASRHRIELPCLAEGGGEHRGVRIPAGQEP